MYGHLNPLSEKQLACMRCSDQQIRLIRFFSLFNAKTGYGRLDTAKSLDKEVTMDTLGLTQFK